MKEYSIVETEMGRNLFYMEGNVKYTIPEIPSNRHYAEYLRYTAWVEAGNTPEDFWTQDDEIEPSEPKEEKETTEGES